MDRVVRCKGEARGDLVAGGRQLARVTGCACSTTCGHGLCPRLLRFLFAQVIFAGRLRQCRVVQKWG